MPSLAWRWTLPLLALYLGVVLSRYPILVASPRLWAEEGSKYFQAAYNTGFSAVLSVGQGYYSVVPSLATWLATLVALSYAPVVTLVISALLQTAPALLVLRSRSAVLPLWGRMVILGALVFSPQAVGEIWLNTVNSQVFLAVAAFLVLLEPKLRPAHLGWLALAVFTAPTAVFLGPLFGLRALRQRSRDAWIGFGVVALAGLVDVLALVGRPPSGDGVGIGATLAAWLRTIVAEGFVAGVPETAQAVIGVAVLAVLTGIFVASADTGAWVLALGAGVVSVLNAEFALMGKVADRYAFAPVLMVVIALVVAAGSARVWTRVPVAAVLVTVLFGGILGYAAQSPSVDSRWPSWRDQVESGATEIRLWPNRSIFVVHLRPRS